MKIIVSIILCITMTGCRDNKVFKMGDVNMDGEITVKDYAMIQLHIMEVDLLNDEQIKLADVNGDGEVHANDYLRIKDYLAGKIPSLME